LKDQIAAAFQKKAEQIKFKNPFGNRSAMMKELNK